MSTFRHKLRKEVVDPALDAGRKATLRAVITKANAKKNSYTISFTDENGENKTQTGVTARVYNNQYAVGYNVDDTVLVEVEDKEYEIIGSYLNDDAAKASIELKNDIYSNTMSSFLPGYIM